MRAVHRRVATGRTDSALTSARGPSGCHHFCCSPHRLWAGRLAFIASTLLLSLLLCLCSDDSFFSLCWMLRRGRFVSHPICFHLFEVRSAFCPRSLLVSLSHRRKGRFGGSLAQSGVRPAIEAKTVYAL